MLLESIYQTISYITGDKLFEHIKDRQPNTARYVSKLHKRYLMSFRQKNQSTHNEVAQTDVEID